SILPLSLQQLRTVISEQKTFENNLRGFLLVYLGYELQKKT
ncbi:MAG: hypothetical protein Q617_SPSC00026G0001, partial [Streptococcus sp. DORA_10]